MKKFLLSMLLLIVGIPSFAQKGQIELSLYGGSLTKVSHPQKVGLK